MWPLSPHRYFERISHVDIQRDLIDRGLTHVLLDIDNTILTREEVRRIPADVSLWMAKAREMGISFCLVSNSLQDSAYELAERLDMPIVSKAYKPLPPAMIKSLKVVGGTRKTTVIIGDQIITDILGGNLIGIKTIMVLPLLRDVDLPHTVIWRAIERAVMGKRQPEPPSPACLELLAEAEASTL